MKKTFLDFVEEQNNYREGLKVFESFKTSDIDKVIELINKVLAKHIKDKKWKALIKERLEELK